MPNTFFQFKKFIVHQHRCAMKVTTDACSFGAWVANDLANGKNLKNSLDIGTGTGLLSLMVAQQCATNIDAIEVNEDAAAQATNNIALSPWPCQIKVVHEDVLRWQNDTLYDCIFSNPPFYENELKSPTSSKNAAHHDEGVTLSALLPCIQQRLTEDGVFYLLLPAKREAELDRLFQQSNLFLQTKVRVKQTPHHQPFRLMVRGSKKQPARVDNSTITIKNETNQYTPELIALLRDYYLHL